MAWEFLVFTQELSGLAFFSTVKRLIISLLAIVAWTSISAQSTIKINGVDYPVDTLEQYQVGPGTVYTRFNIQMGSTMHHLYLLTVDLTNPYIKIEECPGGDRMGVTELMTRSHQRLDSAQHHPIGSVNCNFWCVASQNTGGNEGLVNQPFGGTAKDGYLVGDPDDWNSGHGDRGFFMIDDLGHALIRNMKFSGRVAKGNSSRAIRECNRTRVNPNADEIIIFNRFAGPTSRLIPDSAIEIVFEPVAGQEWVINDSMECVVTGINHTGATPLSGKTGVLQGRGARGTWLTNNFAVGDHFKIKLGIYSAPETYSRNQGELYSADSIAPRIMQMVTGNCLVMCNGVLTSRNSNEGYNNQNYPRTMLATNNEGTKVWMLVSERPGNYTTEMCQILRYDGATWAAGMDGGGSAQMNLFGSILNPTTEATPRAVSNSLFVIQTAPDDTQASRIDFVDNLPGTMSSYASYTPVMRAYNQYGVLLSNDFTDYTLTCEPASLGTISADGRTFIAGTTAGSGTLTAHFGEATATRQLTIEAGELSLRLDSVVIDTRDYAIEAYSSVEGNQLSVAPSFFTWSVGDPAVCEVSADGVLRGLTNGQTTIQGLLGESNIEMKVSVEIPDAPALFTAFPDTNAWQPTSNNTAWGIVNQLPALCFTVSTARSPQIKMEGLTSVFGLPDSLQILADANVDFKQLSISAEAGIFSGSKSVIITTPTTYNGYTAYTLTPEKLGASADDIASYPIRLKGLNFTLKNVKTATDYHIAFPGIVLYYDRYVVTLLPEVRQEGGCTKMIFGNQVIIEKDGRVYNVSGQRIR